MLNLNNINSIATISNNSKEHISQNMPFSYYPLKMFAVYSMTLFFRDINVINYQNLPKQGPTIVYGNHNNQFVDGMLLMAIIKRQISFIAAAVSCRRPFIGPLIKGTGAIPVQRPQDVTEKGQGKIIKVFDNKIIGQNTKFTKISVGALLSIVAINKSNLKVTEILNDEQLTIQGKIEQFIGQSDYKITPKLQFNDLYENVWSGLKDGKCIGIFPQGGSHDKLSLLPLKAGICIMALGAMQKYGVPVKLVPCGFNYYNPKKFRSKVIMQFGQAYTIPQQLVDLYKKNKKQAISILLSNLQKMLNEVTTQFKSYNELSTLFIARQLYTMNSLRKLTMQDKLKLNRRFAKGFKLVATLPQYKEPYEKLVKFCQYVHINGIKLTKEDYFSNVVTDFVRFIFYLQKCLVRSAIALPGFIMMYPTTALISYLAQKERIKCKKASKVKQQAHDVVGSYKIMLSMFLLPLTASIHSSILYLSLTKYFKISHQKSLKASLLMFALLPIYALILVKSFDSFGRSWTKLKHFFLRLFNRNMYNKFNTQKKKLSKTILEFIQQHGNKVVQNLQQNRIVHKSQIAISKSQLYIFDEDKQAQIEQKRMRRE